MEETHKKLYEIYKRMQKLHEDNDTEKAHQIADDLLIETIEVLGEELNGVEYMKPLIDSYEKLNKWYG